MHCLACGFLDRVRLGLGLVIAAGACHSAPRPSLIDRITADEFARIAASGLAANQFGQAEVGLRIDDQMPGVSSIAGCMSKRDRLAALDTLLSGNAFLRESNRALGDDSEYCAGWIRHTHANRYVNTHPAARHTVGPGREVLDLVRICARVEARDAGCETFYKPSAGRFVGPEGGTVDAAIHLEDENADDLHREVDRYLAQVLRRP